MPLVLVWIPREVISKWRDYARTFERSGGAIVAQLVRQMQIRQLPADWFKDVDPGDLEGLWQRNVGKEEPR